MRGANLYEHLGIWSRRLDETSAETLLRTGPEMRISGGLRAAPLGLAMERGSYAFLFEKVMAVPSQITVHIRDGCENLDEVRVISRLVRLGRTVAVTEGEILDSSSAHRVLGYGAIIWAVVGEPSGALADEVRPDYVAAGVNLAETVGIKPTPDSQMVSLDTTTPQMLGPGGVLHAGMLQLMTEEAAIMVGSASGMSGPLRLADCTFNFLQPSKVGPYVGTADIVHSGDDGMDLRVSIVDRGNNDRQGCLSWVRLVSG